MCLVQRLQTHAHSHIFIFIDEPETDNISGVTDPDTHTHISHIRDHISLFMDEQEIHNVCWYQPSKSPVLRCSK